MVLKHPGLFFFLNFHNVRLLIDTSFFQSHDLADAFLATPFLNAQYNFLKSKGKTGPAYTFWFLKTTRPLWSKLLK